MDKRTFDRHLDAIFAATPETAHTIHPNLRAIMPKLCKDAGLAFVDCPACTTKTCTVATDHDRAFEALEAFRDGGERPTMAEWLIYAPDGFARFIRDPSIFHPDHPFRQKLEAIRALKGPENILAYFLRMEFGKGVLAADLDDLEPLATCLVSAAILSLVPRHPLAPVLVEEMAKIPIGILMELGNGRLRRASHLLGDVDALRRAYERYDFSTAREWAHMQCRGLERLHPSSISEVDGDDVTWIVSEHLPHSPIGECLEWLSQDLWTRLRQFAPDRRTSPAERLAQIPLETYRQLLERRHDDIYPPDAGWSDPLDHPEEILPWDYSGPLSRYWDEAKGQQDCSGIPWDSVENLLLHEPLRLLSTLPKGHRKAQALIRLIRRMHAVEDSGFHAGLEEHELRLR